MWVVWSVRLCTEFVPRLFFSPACDHLRPPRNLRPSGPMRASVHRIHFPSNHSYLPCPIHHFSIRKRISRRQRFDAMAKLRSATARFGVCTTRPSLLPSAAESLRCSCPHALRPSFSFHLSRLSLTKRFLPPKMRGYGVRPSYVDRENGWRCFGLI